jgi:hypothetical protein
VRLHVRRSFSMQHDVKPVTKVAARFTFLSLFDHNHSFAEEGGWTREIISKLQASRKFPI